MNKKRNYKDIIDGMVNGTIDVPAIDLNPQITDKLKSGELKMQVRTGEGVVPTDKTPPFEEIVKELDEKDVNVVAISPLKLKENGSQELDLEHTVMFPVKRGIVTFRLIPFIDGYPVPQEHPEFHNAFNDMRVERKYKEFIETLFKVAQEKMKKGG